MKKEEIELVGAVHKAKIKSTRLFEDQVAVFRETAKGIGKLKYNPHEAYEEEIEKRLG